jgi:uncharacterized protein (DUF924 family)
MPPTAPVRGATFAEVLGFWFGEPQSPELGRSRPQWFRKDRAFDESIRSRFGATLEAAAAGRLEGWEDTPYAALALAIVLDQFPRNLFRDDPRAFESDARALAVARRAIARGFDRVLRPIERTFLYLPFEHSEELAAQRRALALFSRLRDFPDCASSIDYARRHYEIILRFGRFPHRNAALGRASTEEEQRFLTQPGSRF